MDVTDLFRRVKYSNMNQVVKFSNLKRGILFVRPPKRPIDDNTVPDDGNEFIHKYRRIDSRVDFRKPRMEEIANSSKSRMRISEGELRKKKYLQEAAAFARRANDIQCSRKLLKEKFPQAAIIDVHNEINACTFCLGSEKCVKIYKCDPSAFAEANEPHLNIVIHLKQSEIYRLVRCTFKWYKHLGLDDHIAKWINALFSCTDKPIADHYLDFLCKFFSDLKLHLQSCEEKESDRVRQLMSLLENYFVLKTNKTAGDYLMQIKRLRR